MDDFVNPDKSGGAGSAKPGETAVVFLKLLKPAGPWVLSAIDPITKEIETVTRTTPDEIRAYVAKFNGTRNLYYSVNPTRGPMSSKAAKTDIAVIEYALADLDRKGPRRLKPRRSVTSPHSINSG